MHSSDRKHYLTTLDIAMLRRILDQAGLPEGTGTERRDEAARLLIAFFEQGISSESRLRDALQASMTASSTVTSRGYQIAREQFHSGAAPMARAGAYRYGRRIERNGTWTIYHVFSGVPAEYAAWKMVGLNAKTADRALRILNVPASAHSAP